ncbi:MAG: ribosomal RNA small subunit methyltransferase A [Flammeovirgaceae bacterium TMED290]|nr:MAG: ribosomal RNA small subunit methyltransferase A [Flammeovirgaceae bacterium TMED290]|tara:strand:- start:12006 stop:12779 length:774 start_codon:yes stop_codon:yes gene_type:complete
MTKIKTKKKFGQHFLVNEDLAYEISKKLLLRKNIFEIGPGKGVLTKTLYDDEKINLVVSEIDRDLVDYLRIEYPNLVVMNGDVLELNFKNIFNENYSIIGNLPYNISSQILFKILENKSQIHEFVIMLQKEVAERICSSENKKSYGILSILTQTYYDVGLSEVITPDNFDPPPKVNSCIVYGKRKKDIVLKIPFRKFKKIVKNCFQNRRKTLRNSLKNLNLPKEFTSNDIFSRRAEQLNLNEFLTLSTEIIKVNHEV